MKYFFYDHVLRVLIVLVAAPVAVYFVWPWYGNERTPPQKVAAKEKTSPTWEIAKPRIEEMDRLVERAINSRISSLSDWFTEKEKGRVGFAESVLSIKGKWALVASVLKIGEPHAFYLGQQFNQHLFSPQDLGEALEQVVSGYLNDLDALENELIVHLLADIQEADLGRGNKLVRPLDEDAFKNEIKDLVKQLAPKMGVDMGVLTGKFAATMIGPGATAQRLSSAIVIRLAGAIVNRLAISTTFYGARVVAGVATFGVGAAAMIVVERIIEAILQACGYDANRDVQAQVTKAVGDMRHLIINGRPDAKYAYDSLIRRGERDGMASVRKACQDAAVQIERGGGLGLMFEMQRIHHERSLVRTAALRKRLVEGGP